MCSKLYDINYNYELNGLKKDLIIIITVLDSPQGWNSSASLQSPFLPTFLVILVIMFDLIRANIWLHMV